MKKATNKQQAIAVLIILPIMFGGIFGLVFGIGALTDDLPERDDSLYPILIGVIGIPILASFFIIKKLLSRRWGVELK